MDGMVFEMNWENFQIKFYEEKKEETFKNLIIGIHIVCSNAPILHFRQ